MLSQRTPIAVKLSIYLVLVTTLVLGSVGYFEYRAEDDRLAQNLRHALALDADQIAPGLALPVWNFDRPQIDKIIESMMKDEIVSGLVVKLADEKGTVHSRARDGNWNITTVQGNIEPGGQLVEKRDIIASNQLLGTVTLYGTPKFMIEQLRKTGLLIVLYIVLLDAVLTIILYLLLWRTVLKPLKAVEEYASSVSSGEMRRVRRAPSKYQGELEVLRASIEKMVDLLDARYVALQKQEIMLQSVLNAVPQSIFWKDSNSVYMGCNQVFARAVGLNDPEKVAGKTDFELPWPREEAEAYRSQDQAVMKTGQPKRHIVAEKTQADGKRFWVDTSKVPLADGKGRVYGVLGIYDDITEQKEAEQTLARQLAFDEIIQRLLARFASTACGDMDEVIQHSLEVICRFIGAELGFLIEINRETSCWSCTHEWAAPGVEGQQNKYQNIPIGTEPWTEQKILEGEVLRINRTDELPREAEATRKAWELDGFKSMLQVPLRGRDEIVQGSVGLVAISSTITWQDSDIKCLRILSAAIANVLERGRTEAALRGSEARYRTLFEAAQDAIFINDGETFMDCNPKALDMFRCRREEIVGQSPIHFSPLVQPEGVTSAAKAQEKIKAALAGMPQRFEWRHKRLDGSEFDAEVNLNRIDLDHKSAMLGMVRDITGRKQAEEYLQKSRQQLRALSARLQSLREEERTHLAREIHDHLGQLLTALKLDLRAIERRIVNAGDAELKAALQSKLVASRELTDELIKSIQQIASELRPALLDRLGLEAAIDAEGQTFQSRTGVKCVWMPPRKTLRTTSEQATAVFRIFQEILTNVARHSHATGLTICLDEEADGLVLCVGDNGVGMQPGELDNPTSLGLLGMQERAAILGGKVTFAPNAGGGTLVTVWIPLNPQSAAAK